MGIARQTKEKIANPAQQIVVVKQMKVVPTNNAKKILVAMASVKVQVEKTVNPVQKIALAKMANSATQPNTPVSHRRIVTQQNHVQRAKPVDQGNVRTFAQKTPQTSGHVLEMEQNFKGVVHLPNTR